MPPIRPATQLHKLLAVVCLLVCSSPCTGLAAQENDPPDDEVSSAPDRVDVNPVARDEEIGQRLQNVLTATGWFQDPAVRVEQGVVFLSGQSESDDRKKWAGDLARNTQDVVAVVNRMETIEPSIWDLTPAWRGLYILWRDFVRAIPFFLFGLLVLILSVFAGMFATGVTQSLLAPRIEAVLLRNVVARAIGLLTFLFGTYIVLRVSGLTQLALTVVGGTGLIGLAVGIAFRDITENFLASIFLSMQQPFETGDLIAVTEVTGYVQQLNVRTTILMTLDGNLVQIPNATVYKSNIRNFTTNSNRREDFVIGIGYDDSIGDAQALARGVLESHPAVLNDPEPAVLVDQLGTSTVNLRVYFWLNGREHSWLKVRSSVIRLIKRAFQENGVSMPDEAREVVFPQGVPVAMLNGDTGQRPYTPTPREDTDSASTKAEAGLYSEASVIDEQAKSVQPLQEKDNLLKSEAPSSSSPASRPKEAIHTQP